MEPHSSPEADRPAHASAESELVAASLGHGMNGLRVVALESRMSDQTATLIARAGGVAVRAPSMREVPLEDNVPALEFARRLMAGDFDVVIFLTGVGAKHLAEAIETRYQADVWRAALANVCVVARGPKPLAVLRGWKTRVDVIVPEPNTWRDLLEALDKTFDIAGKRVAIQEYGQSNNELVDGLLQRGAFEVIRVPVYRWALPEDLAPLRSAILECVDGTVGALVVTSAQQIRHLMQVASEMGLADRLVQTIGHSVVLASVGPVATEALGEFGLQPDIVPEHPKLGPLVKALSDGWNATRKRLSDRAFGTTD